jgi:integrase
LEWELALRRDEILTLEWFQVDVTNRLLRIVNKPEFPTRFGRGWSPKWRKERTMPLTEKAVEILGRIPRRRTFARLGKGKAAELIPVNLVFSRRAGRKGSHIYMRCDEFKHAWDAIRVKAGVAHANYTWHDYRRSWNRYATERGIPTPYRATFLGHRIEVNEDNYETAMGYEFMRAKMGRSMAESAADLDRTVRDLFEVPRKQAQ